MLVREIEDGKMYGRGAADMKSGVASHDYGPKSYCG